MWGFPTFGIPVFGIPVFGIPEWGIPGFGIPPSEFQSNSGTCSEMLLFKAKRGKENGTDSEKLWR